MHENKEITETYLFYIALSLFAIDFFLQGMTIFFLMTIAVLLIKRLIVVDRSSYLLLLFSISFIVFSALAGCLDLSEAKTVICVFLAYVLGMNINNITDTKITKVLVLIALFMAGHALLNLAYNFSQFGASALSVSRSYDFWTREISGSTGQASKFTPFIAIFFYLFFYVNKKTTKIAAVFILLAAVVYDFELGGRTALILMAISLLLGMMLGLIKERRFWKNIKLIVIVFLVIVIAVLAYNADVFGIKSAFENSYFNHRFYSVSGQGITEDSRMSRKIAYITHILDFPLGGKKLSIGLSIGHAHELWLDTFDIAGIVPYLLLLIYTLGSIKRSLAYFKNPYVDPYMAIAYFSFVIVMNLQFFVEPIIEGSPKLIVYYCLIDGMVSRYLSGKGVLKEYEGDDNGCERQIVG